MSPSLSSSAHRFSARTSGRSPSAARASNPAFPSCPISARPAQLDRPGASPSWEDLLGQR